MDLKLDETTHDLVTEKSDLAFVRRDDAVRQNLKQNYLFFLGEWFLDTTKGVPYYQLILVKNPNLDVVNSTLINVALQTPGIIELQDFNLDYLPAGRGAEISLQAKSTGEDINFQQILEV